jgi:hypothetical protein
LQNPSNSAFKCCLSNACFTEMRCGVPRLRCHFERRFAHHFERSGARSEYGHAWWIFRFGRSGLEGNSSGSPLATRPEDCPGKGDDACLPDRLPVDRGIIGAETCPKYGPVNGCFRSRWVSGFNRSPDRTDEYPGSTPDQFRELAHYLKSHTPPKMKLCERSELYVPQNHVRNIIQYLNFPVFSNCWDWRAE